MGKSLCFIDTEIGIEDRRIRDIGAVRTDGATFHSTSLKDFAAFISNSDFICGHNIVHFDLEHLNKALGEKIHIQPIDTLYLSPLLFPRQPYHSLVKDDKLIAEELNNPVNDCMKAQKLLFDEVNAFNALPSYLKQVFYHLLYEHDEFRGFFDYLDYRLPFIKRDSISLIKNGFTGSICSHANLPALARDYPVELAYALALIWANDESSITPPWLLHAFPNIENVFTLLRNTPCASGCEYCKSALNTHKALKRIFGYDGFRTYEGEPLQERAVQAAVEGGSLLAVFPTGGGKSLTFQLPALMAAATVRGLTVVISPLQSLMKDQVDNLNARGIASAVTINGLLDPIERANSLERIANGAAHLLYISPEQLRSRTIEKLLSSRNVIRFVIDEAHCFSSWGQDFRVDYLYIGEFIKILQSKRRENSKIPVSCFTATAKQKVITDICDYFKKTLDVDLELFASSATRDNLKYSVIHCETEEQKYGYLRSLIAQFDYPTIVYVSRTKRTRDLAEKLSRDGFPARPFNGKMDANDKVANQEAFINNEISVIVATSAFGMGVDKKDVQLVVHYDISSSLEDYVQEAGRAGRDSTIQAACYVLYNDNDLDKHFVLLNQTKLSMSEIQQVWKAVKDLTKQRQHICCSPLEIARQAGWNESGVDVETRVKTAIQALETAGYVKRGHNIPHVYATGITSSSVIEASKHIEASRLFTDEDREIAIRIISSLIGKSKRALADNDDAESRIDYLADMLGLRKREVIRSVNLMRQAGILDDSQDMTAYIQATDTANKSLSILERFAKLERFVLSKLTANGHELSLKLLNEEAQELGLSFSNVRNLRIVLHFLTIKSYICKEESAHSDTIMIYPSDDPRQLLERFEHRIEIGKFILNRLYSQAKSATANDKEEKLVNYSLVGLYREFKSVPRLDLDPRELALEDVAEALLHLSKIGSMKLEGGFLVLYNGMEIQRMVLDNRIKYKVHDYRLLDEFYQQKIRMIHIVGEYANLMVRDYDAALRYVNDYFQMDHRKFIDKYFKGDRKQEIDRTITPKKYKELFDELSDVQAEIISDKSSKYIVVAAGPGSGKTKVLVHKLASLLLLEDVKHDQLLMLTFSRAAATEFKKRLIGLIGNVAHYVDIKTFHSYCFDLLGRIGNLEHVDDVVEKATKMMHDGDVEPGKITKSVLVIDEAQDMSEKDFDLVRAIMQANDDMRIIAVGDDDQNIFSFRGSDSKYFRMLIDQYGATKYEMPENYRSQQAIVSLANCFVERLHNRMKSMPGISVHDELGKVTITHHHCSRFIDSLVEEIRQTHGTERACVLTRTNDEAMQVLGLLEKNSIHAKLIQSLGKQFRLSNLIEIRYFLAVIKSHGDMALVSDDVWQDAENRLAFYYGNSACYEVCVNLLDEFKETNPEKYLTDFEDFIGESQYEDFYNEEYEIVYVSTMHKAKGREFDTVYMLLQDYAAHTDEQNRTLYVGMTRAKRELHIHCNTNVFNDLSLAEVQHIDDPVTYREPAELLIQMTHRDVYLDYFKGRQDIVKRLRSGMVMSPRQNQLCVIDNGRWTPVVKFSKAFSEQLARWAMRNYSPVQATIQFIVAWKGENDSEETYIVLPTLKLAMPGES